MPLFDAFSGVFSIFLIGLLGYLLARGGWVSRELFQALPWFVTNIVLPPFSFCNIVSAFKREQIMELLQGLTIPLLSIFSVFILSVIVCRLMNMAGKRRGIFQAACAASNAVNIGIPINLALFGDAALPYIMVYFFANSLFFWSTAVPAIAVGGGEKAVPRYSLETLKRIMSPPMIGFLCGILAVLLDISLPVFAYKAFRYVGDMNVGLAVMYIGMMMRNIKLEEFRFDRDMVMVFAARFCISPLIVFCLSLLIPIPALMRNVFIIQCSLPVMMNVAIISAYYKADARYAAVLTGATTLASLVTIPLFMFVVSAILPWL